MANAKLFHAPDEQPVALETLGHQVVDALGQEILSGRLKPGQRVDLAHFAAKWNVSITPVRDAAKQLEIVGFLKVLPRRGVFVAELTAKDVKDIFDVRIALESAAIRLATPHIPPHEAERVRTLYIKAGEAAQKKEQNPDVTLPDVDLLIHTLAFQYCDNARLQKMMESMWGLVEWCQNTITSQLYESFLTTLPEHIAICDAVCAVDAEGATTAMYTHLSLTSERIQHLLQQ